VENKLYSYTTLANLVSSMVRSPGYLEVKQGLTLKQEIEVRTSQQDNASSTSDIIVLSTLIVHDNDDVKLDDKVRDALHDTPLFKKYIRFNNKDKKHEWSLVKIDDLIPDFDSVHEKFIELQENGKNPDKFLYDHFLHNKKKICSA